MVLVVTTLSTYNEFVGKATEMYSSSFVKKELCEIRQGQDISLKTALTRLGSQPNVVQRPEVFRPIFERFAEDWTRQQEQDLTYQPQLRQRNTKAEQTENTRLITPTVLEPVYTGCRSAGCIALAVALVALAAIGYSSL